MSEKRIGNFKNYKQTVFQIITDLKTLKGFSDELLLSGNSKAIESVIERLNEDNFNVAIVGEFKRGKSTLINALLEKNVLPTDVIPTTATLNKVSYGINPYVNVEFHDGHSEDIDIDKLNYYVTKLTPESEEMSKLVKQATVYYPINYCKNGVTIIDTPGLNDDEIMTEVTLSVLPEADAAILVMMASSPFSQYERDFLEKKIIAGDLGRVIFVVTGIDLYDEEDAEKVLNTIRRRIESSILKKAENVYGKDSDEYSVYQRKLGSIRLYGLSAKRALKAKEKGDERMLAESKFREFENGLEQFLTEERGAIALSVPLNRIAGAGIEIIKAIQLKVKSLSMEESEFSEKREQALAKIESIRDERRDEFEKINRSAEEAYTNILPLIDNYWDELEKVADATIDSYALSNNDIKKGQKEDTSAAIMTAVQDAMKQRSQEMSEKLQNEIEQALSDEIERIGSFEESFYKANEDIMNIFASAENDNSSALLGSAVGFGIGMFSYMFAGAGGGAVEGYKAGGWKGALLGGGVGLGAGSAVAFGSVFALTALSIPLTWPIALAVAAGASIAGTMGGKYVTGLVFSRQKIERFKDEFKEAVHKQLEQTKASNDFSDSVRKQINTSFESLKEKLRTETETVLTDLENQLEQIKVDFIQAKSLSEAEQTRYNAMIEEVKSITANSGILLKEISDILNKE